MTPLVRIIPMTVSRTITQLYHLPEMICKYLWSSCVLNCSDVSFTNYLIQPFNHMMFIYHFNKYRQFICYFGWCRCQKTEYSPTNLNSSHSATQDVKPGNRLQFLYHLQKPQTFKQSLLFNERNSLPQVPVNPSEDNNFRFQ